MTEKQREQREFQKKLIAGYKRDAARSINKEDKI